MDQMFIIPKGRKKVRAGRICLLMGLTGLLFLMVAFRFGEAAELLMGVSELR